MINENHINFTQQYTHNFFCRTRWYNVWFVHV